MRLSATALGGSINSSSIVIEKRTEYMDIEAGWWEDIVISVEKNVF